MPDYHNWRDLPGIYAPRGTGGLNSIDSLNEPIPRSKKPEGCIILDCSGNAQYEFEWMPKDIKEKMPFKIRQCVQYTGPEWYGYPERLYFDWIDKLKRLDGEVRGCETELDKWYVKLDRNKLFIPAKWFILYDLEKNGIRNGKSSEVTNVNVY